MRLVKVTLTLALLAYVLYSAGLYSRDGWNNLGQTFASADRWLLCFAVVYAFFIDYVSSIKWYFLSRARNLTTTLGQLFKIYLIGRFFNLLLPSSFGGDVIRIHLQGKLTGQPAESAAVVFVERFSGLFVLLVLTLISVVYVVGDIADTNWLLPATALAMAILLAGLGTLLSDRCFGVLHGFIGRFGSLGESVCSKLAKFRNALLGFRDSIGSLVLATVNSLAFYFFAIINVWVSALVFAPEVRLADMASAVPLIMFIMNLPVSIGGIGLMEFAYVFILGIYGLSPAAAISTALLMRLKTLLVGGTGGLLFAAQRDQHPSPYEVAKSRATSK